MPCEFKFLMPGARALLLLPSHAGKPSVVRYQLLEPPRNRHFIAFKPRHQLIAQTRRALLLPGVILIVGAFLRGAYPVDQLSDLLPDAFIGTPIRHDGAHPGLRPACKRVGGSECVPIVLIEITPRHDMPLFGTADKIEFYTQHGVLRQGRKFVVAPHSGLGILPRRLRRVTPV